MSFTNKTTPAWTDTITSADLKIASISMFARGEMPVGLSNVLPNEIISDGDIARRFLNYAAKSILDQSLLWQSKGIDIELIADKLRQVPSQSACAVYERLFRISTAIRKSLMAMSVEPEDDEPRTKST